MSVAKRLADDRIFPGSWRRIVKGPSRMLWAGGTLAARCPTCPWSIQDVTDSKLPKWCPRCGSWLTIKEVDDAR